MVASKKTPKRGARKRAPEHRVVDARLQVEERHKRFKDAILRGLSLYDACKEAGFTPKRGYVVARRHNLPTNPRIFPNGNAENSIARCLAAGWSIEAVARASNSAPARIHSIVARIATAPVLDEGDGIFVTRVKPF